MPLSITLGYTAKGRDALPQVLYCGLDADAASAACEAPPAGIVRTEFIKAPVVTRRRFHEAPAVPAETAAAPAPESSDEETPRRKK